MKKKIIICGAACSGKDYLAEKLIQKGYKKIVGYTTRPKRVTDIENVTYRFVDESTYLQMESENLFRFSENYIGWYYGFTKEDYDTSNLFIMTPSMINNLSEAEFNEAHVVYLNPPKEIRLERLLKRNDADNAYRRISTDTSDFKDFVRYHEQIQKETFTLEDIYLPQHI